VVGEGVAELVSEDVAETSLLSTPSQHEAHPRSPENATAGDEVGIDTSVGVTGAECFIAVESLGCPCAEGNGTGSATLSQNDHFAPVQVDISNFQTNQLPLSDSGIGEKSDDGFVAAVFK